MENFVVSARKYRPSTFDTVVGQRALVTTLKNAITGNQLAHAYLFCGPRGVGKTTSARIFAKAINCEHLVNGEPCNECESCRSFNEGRSYNIYELDAASNNGVDSIRELIDQVQTPPQIGKYRIYVIDEVHMLSASAFNAFLKTLEEPPSYVIFILATTEKHKILPTILSRCQVYDFNRISVEDTVAHLQNIAEKEGIEAELDALNIIAVKSDGGMRDALSTFDQVVSFCGKKITYKDVIENLNILDYDYYFTLTNLCLQQKMSDALLLFNDILNKGFDAGHFISGLLTHFRDLLVCKDEVTAKLLEVGAGIRDRYIEQAKQCPADFLLDAMEEANQSELDYKQSKNKRLLVELMLIRLCQLTDQKKKSRIRRRAKRALLPFASLLQTPRTAPVTTPTVQPPIVSAPAAQAPTVHTSSITSVDKSKIGRLYGSINRSKNMAQTVASTTVSVRENAYTEQQIDEAWFRFVNTIPEHPDLHFVFSKAPNKNANTLTSSVDNFVVYNKLNDIKPQLQRYLSNAVSNDTIAIEFTFVEGKKKPTTPREKARAMNESNGELLKMFTSWGLKLQ